MAVIAAVTVWVVASVVLSLIIGKAIKLRDERH